MISVQQPGGRAICPSRQAPTCYSTKSSLGASLVTRRHFSYAQLALLTLSLTESARAEELTYDLAGVEYTDAQVQNRQGLLQHTEAEWKKILNKGQYRILRTAATELPFTSPLNNEKRAGVFKCAGCGMDLFTSDTKYNSGTGWPSFYQAIPGSVLLVPDYELIYKRDEVRCKLCQGHLGHVFEDGPPPTYLRYCMNGGALYFQPSEEVKVS